MAGSGNQRCSVAVLNCTAINEHGLRKGEEVPMVFHRFLNDIPQDIRDNSVPFMETARVMSLTNPA